jgi:hypothetical protein
VKNLGLLLVVILGLSGQTTAPAPGSVRHLVYQFGYNTKVASQGQGTGTTTIDILGPAADGGVMINGTDYWWNTARPRATNTCEVYPNGSVDCSQRPYAISPLQVTLFPLLAKGFFKGLGAAGNGTWTHSYKVYAAILPSSSGPPGTPVTWDCVVNFTGKGPIANGGGTILTTATGKMTQEGGHYLSATSSTRIAYDPAANLPVVIGTTRTHLPQRSIYNNDVIQLKLIQDSASGH